jgi:hypothetical protein
MHCLRYIWSETDCSVFNGKKLVHAIKSVYKTLCLSLNMHLFMPFLTNIEQTIIKKCVECIEH